MKYITIALVLLVVGASAVEQAGFFDKLKNFGKKVVNVGKTVMNNDIVKNQVMPVATGLLNQQLAKKNIPMQFAEEAGFFDKLKNFGKQVVSAGKTVMNNDIVKNQVMPVATGLLNQQLAKKNIPMQFAEESGFFDKLKNFGKQVVSAGKTVMNNDIVKNQVMPVATGLLNQQLAKKNIPMQFSEESGFFDKLKNFGKNAVNIGKQVMNHDIVKNQVMPVATGLLNQQLAKKNIPMQFAEESGFFDKLKNFGKQVVSAGKTVMNNDIVKNQVMPVATGLLNQQLAKKNIPMQF